MKSVILLLATVAVIDGDTIRSGPVDVRLWGIDAPEMHETAGPQSKAALRRIITGPLTCEVKDVDRYGRLVAKCETDAGVDIACELIGQGHARDWPKYSKGFYSRC